MRARRDHALRARARRRRSSPLRPSRRRARPRSGGRRWPTSRPTYLRGLRSAAQRFGIDWAVLAAIGKVECDHGRLDAAGCNPRGSVNKAGAVGPMQFLATTWRRGAQLGSSPPPGPRHAGDLGWVRERRGRRRRRGHLGPGRRDRGRRSLPRRQRRARRLPARALRLQPRRLVRRARAATGRRATAPPRARHKPRASWRRAKRIRSPTRRATSAARTSTAATTQPAALELDPASAPVLQVSARDGRVGFFDCSSLASWAFAKTRGVVHRRHQRTAMAPRARAQPRRAGTRARRRAARRVCAQRPPLLRTHPERPRARRDRDRPDANDRQPTHRRQRPHHAHQQPHRPRRRRPLPRASNTPIRHADRSVGGLL